MSSTPLFDSLRQHRTTGPTAPLDAQPVSAGAVAPAAQQPVPASPVDGPVLVHGTDAVGPGTPETEAAAPVPTTTTLAGPDIAVPAGLVSAIDAIPARLRTTLANERPVAPEDLPFVEAVADALTRAVVDAVVTELDRIAATGLVRG